MARKMVAQLVKTSSSWLNNPPSKQLANKYSSIWAVKRDGKHGWWVWNKQKDKWEARFTRVYYD